MITLKILIEFKVGTIVYLKTDVNQYPRYVIAYRINETFEGKLDIQYECQQGSGSSDVYHPFQLSLEKDISLITTN